MRRRALPQRATFRLPDLEVAAGLATLSGALDPVEVQDQLRRRGHSEDEILQALLGMAWLRQIAVRQANQKECRP